MTTIQFDCRDNDTIELPADAQGNRPRHLIDRRSRLAVMAAIAAGRPLLVRGEPGTGKSQLARAVAARCNLAFVSHVVDARTETRDLIWTMDAVRRLAEAQILGAVAKSKIDEIRKELEPLKFVVPGALWWAFDWESARAQCTDAHAATTVFDAFGEASWRRGCVLLIDEIDKADSSVPNGLLDALGNRQFDVPGRVPVTITKGNAPIVIITTNEERALPDAFLRRCLVLRMDLPTKAAELEDALIARGKAHFRDEISQEVYEHAARIVMRDREEMRKQRLSPPGVAEYVDLLRAVLWDGWQEKDRIKVLDSIAEFALKKHPQDTNA